MMLQHPAGRRLAAAPALLTAGLFVLTACTGGAGGAETAQPTGGSTSAPAPTGATTSAPEQTGTGSPTPTASPTASPETSSAPSAEPEYGTTPPPLEIGVYEGDLRVLADVHHLECISEVARKDGVDTLPEEETGDEGLDPHAEDGRMFHPWSATEGVSVSPGWKLCTTDPQGYFALPSDYTVEVTDPGTLELGEVRATDPTGDVTVVFVSEPSESSLEPAEDVRIVDTVDADYLHTEDQDFLEYVRTSTAQTEDGRELRIELVSVPAGEDQDSYQTWGFGHPELDRREIYATLPLEDGQEPVDVMDSPRYTGLVQVLQEYQPAVQ